MYNNDYIVIRNNVIMYNNDFIVIRNNVIMYNNDYIVIRNDFQKNEKATFVFVLEFFLLKHFNNNAWHLEAVSGLAILCLCTKFVN